MLNFTSLYSGSSGNCLFVETSNTKILIDAGVSLKKIEKLGLIDTDGHTIVRPKFEDIYHFENGLAKVELKNGKVGYINHKGEYVIRPKREE